MTVLWLRCLRTIGRYSAVGQESAALELAVRFARAEELKQHAETLSIGRPLEHMNGSCELAVGDQC